MMDLNDFCDSDDPSKSVRRLSITVGVAPRHRPFISGQGRQAAHGPRLGFPRPSKSFPSPSSTGRKNRNNISRKKWVYVTIQRPWPETQIRERLEQVGRWGHVSCAAMASFTLTGHLITSSLGGVGYGSPTCNMCYRQNCCSYLRILRRYSFRHISSYIRSGHLILKLQHIDSQHLTS